MLSDMPFDLALPLYRAYNTFITCYEEWYQAVLLRGKILEHPELRKSHFAEWHCSSKPVRVY